MFNPKHNLLEEQLATSGIELNGFGDFVMDVVTGGAHSANKAAKKAEKGQKEFNQKVADLTNLYNDELDAADRLNYQTMRDFSYETDLKNWNHNKLIQDYQHNARLKQYEKSNQIAAGQYGLNARGEALGIENEQAAMDDAFIAQDFQFRSNLMDLKQIYAEQNINRKEQGVELLGIQSNRRFGNMRSMTQMDTLMTQGALKREAALVEGLQAEGKAALGQSGKSTAKALQSSQSNLFRGLMALQSELEGTYKQAAIQLAQLNVDASLAEQKVGLNIERIGNAVKNAEDEIQFNQEVMKANLESEIKQSARNIEQIRLDKQIADLNVKANTMLKPEKLPYQPEPQLPPERVFVDRMEALPGYVPPAHQQNLFAAGVSTVASYATAAVGVDTAGIKLGLWQ